jgi:starch synthase
LPLALAARGHRLTVVSPLSGNLDPARFPIRTTGRTVRIQLGRSSLALELFEAVREDVRWIFLSNPALFGRPGLYGEGGIDYLDNALRFAALSAGALAAARALGRWPDVVHANDWQTGPAILQVSQLSPPRPRTVFTVHNLSFQGLFPPGVVEQLGWPSSLMALGALEFYGQLSFIKAGLIHSDALTTVSPTYADEICTPELGCGLDGLLRSRRARLHGILNGIDGHEWNPAGDPALPAPYAADRLQGKALCKAALQREVGLPVDANRPLFTSIGRLTQQKGTDLLIGALDRSLLDRAQVAVLGSGDPALEQALRERAKLFPASVAVCTGFDEGLAHRFEAAGDFFLMPSRFEPCGLSQMYSLRYGTPPIVRATGGLADTVTDASADLSSGTGFVFRPAEVGALRGAIERAIAAFGEPRALTELRRRAMAIDNSWATSSAEFERLYQGLQAR